MNYDLPGFIKLGENIVAYQCERAHTHTRTVHTIAQPCSGFRDAVSFHTEKPKYFLFLSFFFHQSCGITYRGIFLLPFSWMPHRHLTN